MVFPIIIGVCYAAAAVVKLGCEIYEENQREEAEERVARARQRAEERLRQEREEAIAAMRAAEIRKQEEQRRQKYRVEMEKYRTKQCEIVNEAMAKSAQMVKDAIDYHKTKLKGFHVECARSKEHLAKFKAAKGVEVNAVRCEHEEEEKKLELLRKKLVEKRRKEAIVERVWHQIHHELVRQNWIDASTKPDDIRKSRELLNKLPSELLILLGVDIDGVTSTHERQIDPMECFDNLCVDFAVKLPHFNTNCRVLRLNHADFGATPGIDHGELFFILFNGALLYDRAELNGDTFGPEFLEQFLRFCIETPIPHRMIASIVLDFEEYIDPPKLTANWSLSSTLEIDDHVTTTTFVACNINNLASAQLQLVVQASNGGRVAQLALTKNNRNNSNGIC